MHLKSFIKQKDYEKIEYVLRRHWATFLPKVFLFFVLMLVPIALYFLFKSVTPGVFQSDLLYPLFVLFGSVFYLSIYLFFFAEFINYYLDEWIITNDRVIDVEQLGLFSRSISEVELFRIQDVTADVHGISATLFDYGDITIKTASTNMNIIAKSVPHPNKVRSHLIQLAHEDSKYHAAQSGKQE